MVPKIRLLERHVRIYKFKRVHRRLRGGGLCSAIESSRILIFGGWLELALDFVDTTTAGNDNRRHVA